MFGLQIFENTACVEWVEVKRTWRERLLSWPWRPWVVNKSFAKPAMYKVGTKLICHPALLPALRKAVEHPLQATADRPTSPAKVEDVLPEYAGVMAYLRQHLS